MRQKCGELSVEKETLILDVGCGNHPIGDVNCDLFINSTFHRGSGTKIVKRYTPNLVQCPTEKLPFPDKSFSTVYSKAVMEHVDSPLVMLRELVRVASKRVLIIVPHRYLRKNWLSLHYNQHECGEAHKTYFDEKNLAGLIRYVCPNSWFLIRTRKCRAFHKIPVSFPHALYAEIRVDKNNADTVIPLSKLFIERISGIDVTWERYGN